MNDSMRRQWYYNTITGEPELGPQSPTGQRMGPYATREDALDAWQIAKKRNNRWDDEDKAWARWGETPSNGD